MLLRIEHIAMTRLDLSERFEDERSLLHLHTVFSQSNVIVRFQLSDQEA